MKSTWIVTLLLGLVLSSCNNDAKVTIKGDSLRNKVEKAGNEVDSTARSLKDSAAEKMKEIRDTVERRLENNNDTNRN